MLIFYFKMNYFIFFKMLKNEKSVLKIQIMLIFYFKMNYFIFFKILKYEEKFHTNIISKYT